MKPVFVADLQPDQPINSFFLVAAKEILQTRDGKPYLRLELADRTGSIETRMWTGFDAIAASLNRDDIVKVQGKTDVYRNRLQLKIDRMRKAEPAEIDLRDYFPHSPEDIEALYRKLQETGASIANPWLRQMVTEILADPEIAPRLKVVPAAKVMHHAYRGGLVEHVISLCGLCRVVAAHYGAEVDLDLLLTGAILHDVGKIDELEYEGETGYSTEGRLLGHILIGIAMIRRKIGQIEGFPAPLAHVVEHLIASHHGQLEFGSPRPPLFREALLLHFLDDMDSKMGAVRAALDAPGAEPDWTERSPALARQLLRLDRYLSANSPSGQAAPAGAETPSLFEPPAKPKR